MTDWNNTAVERDDQSGWAEGGGEDTEQKVLGVFKAVGADITPLMFLFCIEQVTGRGRAGRSWCALFPGRRGRRSCR